MNAESMAWRSVEVEIVSADIPRILSLCSSEGIPIEKIRQKGALSVSVLIAQKDFVYLERICNRNGATIRVKHGKGIFFRIKQVSVRPVLICVVGIILFFTLWLPERVLFIQVEGNSLTSAGEILNAAQSCGIRFGTPRSTVRSEAMKNALLHALPTLQWAGINTKGCTAIISVQERESETQDDLPGTVSSLVAVRDGIVVTGTATAGNLKCTPGQAVRAGDVLVSGYTDCGISIRAEKAKGEVFALTVRPMTVCAPVNFTQKKATGQIIKKYCLIIGKNRINLSKDSGISYATCDKIRKEYVLTLPGGFSLPVSLQVDSFYSWDTQVISTEGPVSSILSKTVARKYLMENMIAGEILDMVLTESFGEMVYRLEGNFLCSEMIARERNEEILEEYGKNCGEDR